MKADHNQSHTTRLPSGPTAMWSMAAARDAAAAADENVDTLTASAAASGKAEDEGAWALRGEATAAAAAGDILPAWVAIAVWCTGNDGVSATGGHETSLK
jgi:hypothetical protein